MLEQHSRSFCIDKAGLYQRGIPKQGAFFNEGIAPLFQFQG
jgi:hypothetical protein